MNFVQKLLLGRIKSPVFISKKPCKINDLTSSGWIFDESGIKLWLSVYSKKLCHKNLKEECENKQTSLTSKESLEKMSQLNY